MPVDNGQRGFTLIEMSIVLVIIGLIVGGVLVGQDLIQNARLRHVLTDVEKFKTASNTFYIKYGFLAGDFPQATSAFPIANATDPFQPNCLYTDIVTTQYGTLRKGPCNGDGDGLVDQAGGTAGCGGMCFEDLQFWYQLAAAGLIQFGNLTGGSGPGGTWDGSTPGLNIPPAPFASGGYALSYTVLNGTCAPYCNFYTNTVYGTTLQLTGECPQYGWCDNGWGPPGMGAGILTPLQAYRLDAKVDDGRPMTGTVQTPTWGAIGAGCTTSTAGAPEMVTYDTTYATAVANGVAAGGLYCRLIWTNAF